MVTTATALVTFTPTHRDVRIRPSAADKAPNARGHPLRLVLLMASLMILASLPLLTEGVLSNAGSAAYSHPADTPRPGSAPASDTISAAGSGVRDPLLWPFSRDSVWNLPIGASAVYVPAKIQVPSSAGMTTDPDVIIMTPNAPMTPVY